MLKTGRQISPSTWLALLDVVFLVVAGAIGVLTRFGVEDMTLYVFSHIDGFVLFGGSVIVANYISGAYRIQASFSRFNLLVSWFFSLLVAFLVLSITSYAWLFEVLLGRGVLFLSLGWYSVFTLGFKQLFFRRIFRSDLFVKRTVIVGDSARFLDVKRLIEAKHVLPSHKVIAFLELSGGAAPEDRDTLFEGIPLIRSSVHNFEEVIMELDPILLVTTGKKTTKPEPILASKLRKMRFEGIDVFTELSVLEMYGGRIDLSLVDEEYLMSSVLECGFTFVTRFKRLFDLLTVIMALLVGIPIVLLAALVMKIFEPKWPVFYSQIRVGRFGRHFRIWKLRTMVPEAEKESGPVWSGEDDERITRLGSFLRKYRIDELPQLFNVLSGVMSMVGPRPERPEMVDKLKKVLPFYEERSNMLPGLTGWAQIKMPYGDSIEDAKLKLEYDLYYLKHVSWSMDLQILLSTFRTIALGKEKFF